MGWNHQLVKKDPEWFFRVYESGMRSYTCNYSWGLYFLNDMKFSGSRFIKNNQYSMESKAVSFFLVAQLDFSTSFWDPSFFVGFEKDWINLFGSGKKIWDFPSFFCLENSQNKIRIFWRDFDHPGLLENPPLFSWMVFKPRWGSSPFTFPGGIRWPTSESPWGGQSADRRGDGSDQQIKSWMYGSSELFTRRWLLGCKCPRFIGILKGGSGGGDSPNLPW